MHTTVSHSFDVEPIQITFRSSQSYSPAHFFAEQTGCRRWAAVLPIDPPTTHRNPRTCSNNAKQIGHIYIHLITSELSMSEAASHTLNQHRFDKLVITRQMNHIGWCLIQRRARWWGGHATRRHREKVDRRRVNVKWFQRCCWANIERSASPWSEHARRGVWGGHQRGGSRTRQWKQE